MTNQEFSDNFTVELSSYAYPASFGEQSSIYDINLDEYEKSVFLTRAQEETVIELYSGRNAYGLSFEKTEELRRYLDSLIKTIKYTASVTPSDISISKSASSDMSVFYELPEDLAFIILEEIVFNDSSLGCYDGSLANVYPITHDEWAKVRRNPFRGPTKYKALRLDAGKDASIPLDRLVEIVSKYHIGEYIVRYLSKPKPIVLEDLPDGLSIDGVSTETECELDSLLHKQILQRAVILAAQSKGLKLNTK